MQVRMHKHKSNGRLAQLVARPLGIQLSTNTPGRPHTAARQSAGGHRVRDRPFPVR